MVVKPESCLTSNANALVKIITHFLKVAHLRKKFDEVARHITNEFMLEAELDRNLVFN